MDIELAPVGGAIACVSFGIRSYAQDDTEEADHEVETKRTAEEAGVEILSRLQRGEYVAPASQTLGSFLIDDWVPSVKASVRTSTWISYRRTIELHSAPHLGSVQLQGLAPGQLNTLYSKLVAEGRTNGQGGLSPRSVRYVHAVIHRALNDAIRWNRLARNPATAAEPPRSRTGTQTTTTWTREQLKAFLDSVREDRLAAASSRFKSRHPRPQLESGRSPSIQRQWPLFGGIG